jgi:hypothetical protein
MRKQRRGMIRCIPAVVVLGLWSGAAVAQYDEPREYVLSDARFFSAGAMVRDFAPTAGNTTPDSLTIAYRTWMPMLAFHQGPVELMFGYARYTMTGSSREAIFLGTTVTTDLVLAGSRSGALLVPFCGAADYSKSESDGAERDNFNIASLGIGAGLKYRAVSPSLEFTVQALGIIHYSFEGLSTGSGSSTAVLGEVRLLSRHIQILEGLVFGYRYRYQRWALSDARFNYRAIMHGPYLGVLF